MKGGGFSTLFVELSMRDALEEGVLSFKRIG